MAKATYADLVAVSKAIIEGITSLERAINKARALSNGGYDQSPVAKVAQQLQTEVNRLAAIAQAVAALVAKAQAPLSTHGKPTPAGNDESTAGGPAVIDCGTT